jgi:molybdopterin converting factor subunit 1
MTLEILFFASYREQVGQARVTLTLPSGTTVRDAATRLETDYPNLKLKGALAAVNETYAAPEETLNPGDTLAFFPPVAGGSDDGPADDHFFVTDEALALDRYVALASDPSFGALTSFIGTVRSPNFGQEVRYIDYQGYETMILGQMKRAAGELRERFDLGRVVFAHRLGKLEPGEASIIITISSKHRRDALSATHAAIDRLKEILPVWKLEATPAGEQWVAGSSAAAETL